MAGQEGEHVPVAREVGGGKPQGARDGDRLRRAHHRGGALDLPALRGPAFTEVPERGDQGFEDRVVHLVPGADAFDGRPRLAPHERRLGVHVPDGAHGLEVEAPLQRGGHLRDALVPEVGGGDEREPGGRVHLGALAAREFGDRDPPLGEQ